MTTTTPTTGPTQAQIGSWLGVSQPVVSKYVRAGMPVYSLEAAAQWYDQNVAPRARNFVDGREPARFVDSRYSHNRQADDESPPLPEGYSTPEEVLEDMGVLNGAAALQLVFQLAHLALPMVKAGRFEDIKLPLQQALRLVPENRRIEVKVDLDDESAAAVPRTVWEALLQPVLARLGTRSEEEVERGRAEAQNATPAQRERTARWLYQVAAGEWVFTKPPQAAAARAPAKKARRR
jgi:hypothetical protein